MKYHINVIIVVIVIIISIIVHQHHVNINITSWSVSLWKGSSAGSRGEHQLKESKIPDLPTPRDEGNDLQDQKDDEDDINEYDDENQLKEGKL